MADYIYELANSKDLSLVGELRMASNKSLALTLNKAGSASLTYPLDAEHAASIEKYKSAIIVRRNGSVVWSGYVLNINEDVTNNSMSIDAVGWLQRLEKRQLRQQKIYTYVAGSGVDDADIIFDLLAEANFTATTHASGVTSAVSVDGITFHWPSGSSPNVPTWVQKGSKLPNQGVGGSTAYTPAYRGARYEKFQPILAAIDDLVNVENGCDIYVDPQTRELHIYRRRRVVRDDVHFDFQTGTSSVQSFSRTLDGAAEVNHHTSTGSPGVVPQYAESTTRQQEVGPLEGQDALSDVYSTEVLLAYSGNEIVINSQGRITYTVTPFPADDDREAVPRPFDDYNIGDQVRFSALHLPRINIVDQAVRVFGFAVTIDENGNEILGALQLNPS